VSLLDLPAGIAPKFPFPAISAPEPFTIPERVYSPVPSRLRMASLTDSESSITACWFTRHHDGFVRERFFGSLTTFDSVWTVAYAVALSSDYVIEIIRSIWERRSLFDVSILGGFLRDNPLFYRRTRSKIISYWNCYYRHSFPRFTDYTGGHILNFFDECISNTQSTGSA